MLVIGLTGGIGSGKSTVAKFFAELGVEIIDTDQIAREVVAPDTKALAKIVEHFGKEILDNKQLNRKKLKDIVFQNSTEREWLEQLLHPLIRQAMGQYILKVKSAYCIVVIPLLVEKKANGIIDRILVVDLPEEQQITRAQQRDDLSRDQVNAILKAQATKEQRLAAADDVIYNDKDLYHLKQQVVKLHQRYLELADKTGP
jgi:dephospho-CoA kinase